MDTRGNDMAMSHVSVVGCRGATDETTGLRRLRPSTPPAGGAHPAVAAGPRSAGNGNGSEAGDASGDGEASAQAPTTPRAGCSAHAEAMISFR